MYQSYSLAWLSALSVANLARGPGSDVFTGLMFATILPPAAPFHLVVVFPFRVHTCQAVQDLPPHSLMVTLCFQFHAPCYHRLLRYLLDFALAERRLSKLMAAFIPHYAFLEFLEESGLDKPTGRLTAGR